MSDLSAVIVFARAPLLGQVKTRLIPALGEQGALELYRLMLEHALRIGSQCGADTLILACTPHTGHAELEALAGRFNARLCAQVGADLGARMHHALSTALERHQRVVLIGSDCPALCGDDLREALRALQTTPVATLMPHAPGNGASGVGPDAVFVPATDGGYVLVGLAAPCEAIFSDMPWGGPEVMKLTRQRLLAAARKWLELPGRDDVDEAADLARLPAGFLQKTGFAPKF